MRSLLPGLTTRGRCLLAGGVAAALCSIVLNERDLLRVAAFLIALPLISALLAARSRVGLRCERVLLPPRVPAGSNVEVRLQVSKGSHIPSGGLQLEDSVPSALGGTPRFAVDSIRQGRTVQLRYPLRPALRGLRSLGPLTVTITDPFGMAEYSQQLAGQSRLLVLPRVEPLAGLPRGAGVGVGDDGAVRLHAGPGSDDAVVRQYRYGDDLRKVHWKSTAHRDELMVRAEERPWRGGTTVLLDNRVSAHRGTGTEASLEWAVSFVASVCLHLHRNGHHVRLALQDGRMLAGETSTEGFGGTPVLADSDEDILDTLAVLKPSHHRDLVCRSDPGAGQELIAVLGSLGPPATDELVRHRLSGARSLAVLLDVAAWPVDPVAQPRDLDSGKDVTVTAALLRAAGWGVVIARPDDRAATIWSRLHATVAGVASQAATP
ncbi:MAG: DUF58 domain-containing protein [Sciscionella sp.]